MSPRIFPRARNENAIAFAVIGLATQSPARPVPSVRSLCWLTPVSSQVSGKIAKLAACDSCRSIGGLGTGTGQNPGARLAMQGVTAHIDCENIIGLTTPSHAVGQVAWEFLAVQRGERREENFTPGNFADRFRSRLICSPCSAGCIT